MFASFFFIMLQRLLDAKDALQETVMDREYKQWMSSFKKTGNKEEGKTVVEVIVVEKFWESVEEVTSVCEPIISLLRLVNGTVPSVGKVYWKMFQIDNGIEQSATLNQEKKTQLRTSINEQWKMLHTELHSVGFVLDPEYRTILQHENEEVMADFHAMVERVFEGDVQAQVKVTQQHATYSATVFKTDG